MLCLAAVPVRAQAPQRQVFTTDDGLPQNSVHAVLQTRDGFLWAATEGGVARFDGIRFATFNIGNQPAFTSNDSCCLAQAANGELWIGTADGLVRWAADRFSRVDVGPVLQLVAEPSGSVLVLTANGLLRVRGAERQSVGLPDGLQSTALGTAEDGSALVAAGTVVLRARGAAFAPAGVLPAAPVEVMEERGGRLWLRTGSAVWASTREGWRQWRIGTDLPGGRLLSLLPRAGGVLAGTNLGVYRLQPELPAAVPQQGLAGVAVLSATTDTEGDEWLGMDTAGLMALRERPVDSVPALAGDTVTSVVESGRVLWFGTRDSGVKQMVDGVVRAPAGVAGLGGKTVLSLAPGRDGELWVGALDGVFHLRRGGLQHLTSADGLPDDFVRSLLQDGPDGVWAGTRHGAAHLVGGRVDRVLTMADGLPSDVIGTLLRDSRGTLWIGTLHGLARVDGDADGGAVRSVALQDGAGGDGVTALAAAPGALLVGTRSGAMGLVRGDTARAFHVAGVEGEVDAILTDAGGNVWIRMATGVARARLRDLLACPLHCTIPLRHYGTADGMPSVDLSSDGHPSAWQDAQGVLWFATRRGVARIDAAHLPVDRVPPPVSVERVLVDDKSFDPDRPLRVGPGSRRFVFDYAGLSLRAPLQVLYRFKLEGFDHDWTEAGNVRSAEYTNLPAGDYRFVVEARNADGMVSDAPATLHLHIDAPLYRRPWFYAVLLLLAAAAVYGLYRLRLRRVQGEFDAVLQERNRIAREIHDTLAQDFVAVSLQLEVTAQLLRSDATEAAQQQIDNTRLLVRDGIRDARESIWALRAGQSAAALPARLQAVASAESASPVTLRVSGAYRALAPSLEKEVVRIAKEAVSNAHRHAAATHISMELVYSEDAVVLTVRDDGAGFDVDAGRARTGHYGLRGMTERAAAMGTELQIDSVPGQGTVVTLHLNA